MSEPIQGTPAPDNNPQGTVQQPQQPQPTPQNPAAPQPANQPAATPPPASQQPDVAALQRELEQARQSARHFQSEYSKVRNQVQSLVGTQPQSDPIAERAARLTQAGLDKEDAVILARAFQSELAPIQQQNQQLHEALNGTSQVHAIMQDAMSKEPELFRDQRIAQAVFNNLQQVALSGDRKFLTADYAISLGGGQWADLNRPWATQQQAPPAPPQQFRPVGTMGFAGPTGHYAPNPAQQFQQPPDPAVDAMTLRMAQRAGLTPEDLK